MDNITINIYNGEYDNEIVTMEVFNKVIENENCKYYENLGQSGQYSDCFWIDVLYQSKNEEPYRFDLYIRKSEYYKWIENY